MAGQAILLSLLSTRFQTVFQLLALNIVHTTTVQATAMPPPKASRGYAWCELKYLLQANESSIIQHARNVESIAGCDALANAK
jgi:hypothetical protein